MGQVKGKGWRCKLVRHQNPLEYINTVNANLEFGPFNSENKNPLPSYTEIQFINKFCSGFKDLSQI